MKTSFVVVVDRYENLIIGGPIAEQDVFPIGELSDNDIARMVSNGDSFGRLLGWFDTEIEAQKYKKEMENDYV